jgi:hypothetical protein
MMGLTTSCVIFPFLTSIFRTSCRLPKFAKGGTEVDLGIKLAPKDVDAGFRDLTARLEEMGQKWEEENADH